MSHLSDEQFAQERRRLVEELYRPQSPVAEAQPQDGRVDSPEGALPVPGGDSEPKLWELSPQELQARAMAALWPTDDSDHKWVPRPPVSLADYLANGI